VVLCHAFPTLHDLLCGVCAMLCDAAIMLCDAASSEREVQCRVAPRYALAAHPAGPQQACKGRARNLSLKEGRGGERRRGGGGGGGEGVGRGERRKGISWKAVLSPSASTSLLVSCLKRPHLI
jgi:hypothetical protein